MLTISNVNQLARIQLLLESRYKNISIRAFFRAKKINYHSRVILSSGSNRMGALIFSRASYSFDEKKIKKRVCYPEERDRSENFSQTVERGEAPRYTEKSKI